MARDSFVFFCKPSFIYPLRLSNNWFTFLEGFALLHDSLHLFLGGKKPKTAVNTILKKALHASWGFL